MLGEGHTCGKLPGGDDEWNAADWWGKDRTIRAAVLRWLLTDIDALECVHVNGIEFTGARIDGDVNLGGTALDFIVWFHGCRFDTLHLEDAKTRTVILENSRCTKIAADRVEVDGSLHIRESRVGEGVTLTAGRVSGALDLRQSHFRGGDDYALTCARVGVGGGVYLHEAKVHGAATFVNAEIGWDLNASGLETQMYLRINRASIGGRLELSKARLGMSPADAAEDDDRQGLQATAAKVRGSVILDGATLRGIVCLDQATVGGDLSVLRTQFETASGCSRVSVRRTTVAGTLVWKDVTLADTEVVLSDADVGVLDDDLAKWPAAGKLHIDGLSYRSLAGIPSGDSEFSTWLQQRTAWIRKQTTSDYSPQPYGELIAALRAEGYDSAAIDVAVDREKDRRKYAGLDFRQKVQLWLLSAVGYGYRPSRALIGVVLFVAIGWALFSIGHDDGNVVRADNNSKARFVALVYSLDTFVPVIDLGLEKQFTVTGQKGFGVWLQRYYWLHVAAGWLITTLVVLGLTGVVRKE